jgi:dephospho-CoA kinase
MGGPALATVVAFTGAIGSGKSALSKRVAVLLGWPRVSFGEYIRDVAEQNGQDRNDRTTLQKLGQALVMSDVEGFVTSVLAREPTWRNVGNLVVDGVRHVEVRLVLINQVRPSTFKLVYLTIDELTRRQRAQTNWDIPQPQLIRYDQDLTEAQIPKILRAYADLTVDNGLPTEIAAKEVISRLGLSQQVAAAE